MIVITVIFWMISTSLCFVDYANQLGWPETCLNEQAGSPINIDTSIVRGDCNSPYKSIIIDYPLLSFQSQIEVLHESEFHFNYDLKQNYTVTLIGKDDSVLVFFLINSHFHCGSEHKINGKPFICEIHLVHKNIPAINLALVISIPIIQFNLKDGDVEVGFDVLLSKLLSQDNKFYHYTGGLTTPPCSQTPVKWFVLKKPTAVPISVINGLKSWITNLTINHNGENINPFSNIGNNRNTQPLNNRDIFEVEYTLKNSKDKKKSHKLRDSR